MLLWEGKIGEGTLWQCGRAWESLELESHLQTWKRLKTDSHDVIVVTDTCYVTCWVMRSADCTIVFTLRRCKCTSCPVVPFTSDVSFPPRGFRQRENSHKKKQQKSILNCYVLYWHVLYCRRSRSSGHSMLLVLSVCALFVSLCFQTCTIDLIHVTPFHNGTVFPTCFGAANCPTLRHSLLMSWWLPVLLSCATLIVDIPLNMSSSGLELRQS